MHETTLKAFFEGHCSAEELREDLKGSLLHGRDVTHHRIVDMPGEFQILSDHLVRVCEAVLAGQIEPEDLKAIGFCIAASDSFTWDSDTPGGDAVSEMAHWWSSPEINFELNLENARMFRDRLLKARTR